MKKLYSMILAVVLTCSFAFPDVALAQTIDDVESVDVGLEQVLNEAYISFSDVLYDMDVTVSTCYEDFVSNYDATNETIDEYVERLIEDEISVGNGAYGNLNDNPETGDEDYICAIEARKSGRITEENENILREYEQLMSSFSDEGYKVYLPYEAFAEVYNSGIEYIQPRSVTSKWYDNIGDNTTSPKLPQKANYDDYNLLSTVKKGDIVQETDGGIAYYTGHIAIIQGKYYDSGYKQYYLRTIEAGITGVVYGVLDDSRYDYRGVNVYYVTDATQTQKNDAVNFCKNQLGKDYDLSAVLWEMGECKYSSDSDEWYCSELVWAAYYNQGINFYGSSIPKHVYLPVVLAGSSKLTERTISAV